MKLPSVSLPTIQPVFLSLSTLALSLCGDVAAAPQAPATVAQLAYIKASDATGGDEFGQVIAISGNTMVVGASDESSDATGVNNQGNNNALRSGAAYVFVRSGLSWTQQALLKASNTGVFDLFGWSADISGDTIVIGARHEQSNATGVNGDQANNAFSFGAGAVYVFTRSGTTWSQEAYLKASNTAAVDGFGQSVAIHGNTLVVGANNEDTSAPDSGSAYVFTRQGTTWTQQGYLKASIVNGGASFGKAVDIEDDTVAIGAPGDNTFVLQSGTAFIFTRSGTTWTQENFLKASNAGIGDAFGISVSLSSGTLVVGAREEDSDSNGPNGDELDNGLAGAGAAYVFVQNGTSWNQEAYLKASNTTALGISPAFGRSVALSGDRLIVGSPGEKGNALDIGGNELDTGTRPNGAAYYFTRNGTAWTQQEYIKPSNSVTTNFGWSVAIDLTHAGVSTPQDDGGSQGINGNQSLRGQTNSGAAFAFDLEFMNPLPPTGIDACSGDGGDQMGCTNCPCANNAAPGTVGGCLNSAATSARLLAAGDTSVSLPPGSLSDLQFQITGAPPSAFCILNSGDALAPGNMANPCFALSSGTQAMQFDGLRCAIMNTRRHGGRSANVNGEVGVTNSPWGGNGGPQVGIAQAGGGFASGQTRYFQVINRDDPLLSCGRGLNTSQAVEITFTP